MSSVEEIKYRHKFFKAFIDEDLELAKKLLPKCGKININGLRTYEGWPFLQIAVMKRDLEMAKLLIAHGARANVKCSFGDNALAVAADLGYPEFIAPLIRAGAGANDLTGRREAPLLLALLGPFGRARSAGTEDEKFLTVRELIRHGAEWHDMSVRAQRIIRKKPGKLQDYFNHSYDLMADSFIGNLHRSRQPLDSFQYEDLLKSDVSRSFLLLVFAVRNDFDKAVKCLTDNNIKLTADGAAHYLTSHYEFNTVDVLTGTGQVNLLLQPELWESAKELDRFVSSYEDKLPKDFKLEFQRMQLEACRRELQKNRTAPQFKRRGP